LPHHRVTLKEWRDDPTAASKTRLASRVAAPFQDKLEDTETLVQPCETGGRCSKRQRQSPNVFMRMLASAASKGKDNARSLDNMKIVLMRERLDRSDMLVGERVVGGVADHDVAVAIIVGSRPHRVNVVC
jgi:hypothetical protein